MINLEDLKKVKLFDYIGNDTLLKLSEIGNKVAFKKGEHIFRDKDTISSIYIILSGKVALYKLNEAAHKKVIFILGEGVINEVILEDMKSSINCEIFESAEILTFDKKRFINIMSEDFELTKIILYLERLKFWKRKIL